MNVSREERENGIANYRNVTRRDFLMASAASAAVAGGGMGAFYFGYGKAEGAPVRVGVLGTGDEGSVLLGAINPEYIQVAAIADIRPYNVHRAFHGDNLASEAAQKARCGLMAKYDWKTEGEAIRHVKVYGPYEELIKSAKQDGVEAIIIALPLHLHAPAAIAAMNAGLHVITEKLMAHSVEECKEMAQVAHRTGLYLAVGHQRHYNILYEDATDTIKRGILGDIHYIRAQWHRGNMPGNDSWQMPLPPNTKPSDATAAKLADDLKKAQVQLERATGRAIDVWRKRLAQLQAQVQDALIKDKVKDYGYQKLQIKEDDGKVAYDGPEIEELIRWRLWNRTGGGLMAELGSHQLDASSIFIAAAHGGKKQHPLRVMALGNRPIFPLDRDAEDHVCCMYEFPAPGYDAKDPIRRRRKIGVQYASINGNGYGGYGEIVYGTQGTLILQREQEVTLYRGPGATTVKASAAAGPALDTQASGPAQKAAAASGPAEVSRGYTEELEHWAWCIRHPAPENKPRCHPEVALGDAVIALTTNIASQQGKPVDFKEEWFDPERPETPEAEFGVAKTA